MIFDILPSKLRYKIWRKELADLIQEQQWKTGVELGVKSGRSSAAIMKANPNLKLTGIDTWETFSENSAYKNNELNRLKALKLCQDFENLSLIQGDVLIEVSNFEDSSLDFIFYDLYDHRWSNINFVEDVFTLWKPKLKATGAFIGRDFDKSEFSTCCQHLTLPSPQVCLINGKEHPRLKLISPH